MRKYVYSRPRQFIVPCTICTNTTSRIASSILFGGGYASDFFMPPFVCPKCFKIWINSIGKLC